MSKIELVKLPRPASDPEIIEYIRFLSRLAHKKKISYLDIAGFAEGTSIDFVWPEEEFEE